MTQDLKRDHERTMKKAAGEYRKNTIAIGTAVQVDSTKPKLKPPWTQRLQLKCDILLSILRSNPASAATHWAEARDDAGRGHGRGGARAGAYTRALLRST